MLCFKELYLANSNKTIIVKVLGQTDIDYLVHINNDEIKLPRRNFTIDRLMSRFGLSRLALPLSGEVNQASSQPKQLVKVIDSIHHMDKVNLDKVKAKAAANPTIQLANYSERWDLSELVFTNHDNSIIMYYTSSVGESYPAQYSFVKNCQDTTVTNGGFGDNNYWSIDWYIDAYKLHAVEDDVECNGLRELAKSLPPVPELFPEDRDNVVESSPSWHKRYYCDYHDEKEAAAKKGQSTQKAEPVSRNTEEYDYSDDDDDELTYDSNDCTDLGIQTIRR